MDRQVTPPKLVTSPIWGTPPPCKQALTLMITTAQCRNASPFQKQAYTQTIIFRIIKTQLLGSNYLLCYIN